MPKECSLVLELAELHMYGNAKSNLQAIRRGPFRQLLTMQLTRNGEDVSGAEWEILVGFVTDFEVDAET